MAKLLPKFVDKVVQASSPVVTLAVGGLFFAGTFQTVEGFKYLPPWVHTYFVGIPLVVIGGYALIKVFMK